MLLAIFFKSNKSYQSRAALNRNRQIQSKVTLTLQAHNPQVYSSHDNKFKKELYSLKERSKPKEQFKNKETVKLSKTRKIRLLSECLGFM